MKFPGLKLSSLSLCAALLILGVFSMTAMSQAEEKKAPKETARQLRHVVVFKFKESAKEADIKKVEKAFAALPKKISQIKDFEWGTNNSPEMFDKGFTHIFLVTFSDEDDRAIYLDHPAHKKFVTILTPHLEDAFVVDYWAK